MKSNILLLITAMLWGFAFVAQRSGMEYVGPFTFNSIRFTLGGISLIPILIFSKKKNTDNTIPSPVLLSKILVKGGIIAGIILFLGASFQQGGMVYTTAGKAGFITGLYIILVPIFGIIFNQKTNPVIWLGAFIALSGLYLLSVHENLTINSGDLLVLASAIFWAIHVLIISRYSPRTDPVKLAFFQFILCAIISLIAAIVLESISFQDIQNATIPILYAGVISVGIAYTLQVVAQKEAHPSNAAIIMSLEAVFAVIGGWIVLDESIPLRGLIGCSLMLTGMIISQLGIGLKRKKIRLEK